MGIGDELMASGEARRINARTGHPVMILGRDGRPRWHEVWNGVPYLIKRPTKEPADRLFNCGGARPYIAGKTAERWTWRPYKPNPAEIVFTPAERAFAEPYRGMVMLEPTTKQLGHSNKDWGPIYWQQLDSLIHGARPSIKVVQCGPPGTRWLNNAVGVETPSFRLAAAVLAVARGFVGTEGGLMHAAAAVGTPGVIIWSEFISPEITGYSTMHNLRHAGKPCGSRVDCPGCRQSLLAVTPKMVFGTLKEIL